MSIYKSLFLLVFAIFLSVISCDAQSRYKGHRKKKSHHHGFFSSNDKATRKNEKFKKKTSKAGGSNKTSGKTVKKSKARTRSTYVKTFDHH